MALYSTSTPSPFLRERSPYGLTNLNSETMLPPPASFQPIPLVAQQSSAPLEPTGPTVPRPAHHYISDVLGAPPRDNVWPPHRRPMAGDGFLLYPAQPEDIPSTDWMHNPGQVDWIALRWYPTSAAIDETLDRYGHLRDANIQAAVDAEKEAERIKDAQIDQERAAANAELNARFPHGAFANQIDLIITMEGTKPKYTAKLGKQSGVQKVVNTVQLTEYWLKPNHTLVEVFEDALAAQGLAGQFKIGPFVPPCKFKYSKSKGFVTVSNNKQWTDVLKKLLALGEKHKDVQLAIEYAKLLPLKITNPFGEDDDVQIVGDQTHAAVNGAGTSTDPFSFNELISGTHVPTIEGFSQEAQINGGIIMRLKKSLVCHEHRGESGGPGECYVDPESGTHLFVSFMIMKAWATWISKHPELPEAEKYVCPPPELLSDMRGKQGAPSTSSLTGLDGRIKPRGRTGPHAAPPASASAPASVGMDAAAIVAAAVSPLGAIIANLVTPTTRRRPRSESPDSPIPERPKRRRSLSPAPKPGDELNAFLRDLTAQRGVVTDGWAVMLETNDWTPDVLADKEITRRDIEEYLDISSGMSVKVKSFAVEWVSRLHLKLDC